jgi:hypothetical protein
MNDTQRGADGGEGREEQIAFSDAVADDPEMTPEQKIHWLRITAADYLEKLEVAETLIEGHQMRFDALVETMQRVGARLAAAERVVSAARAWKEAREVLYASNGSGRMAWPADRCIDRQHDLDAALASLTPARDETKEEA